MFWTLAGEEYRNGDIRFLWKPQNVHGRESSRCLQQTCYKPVKFWRKSYLTTLSMFLFPWEKYGLPEVSENEIIPFIVHQFCSSWFNHACNVYAYTQYKKKWQNCKNKTQTLAVLKNLTKGLEDWMGSLQILKGSLNRFHFCDEQSGRSWRVY